jgi:hydroxymethylbilane synthase
MQRPPIRIGTRASKLALVQARWTQAAICAALGEPPERKEAVAPLVEITTSGDRIQDRRLLEVGGKALFTKEIEEALLDGRIDCAVHSLKDVPAEEPAGLTLAAYPEREDPRDAFISERFAAFAELPHGARLGAASLRRQAQALRIRPDLEIVLLRGNVDTRLRKLADGECDATLLALAGLNRLGLAAHAKEVFDPYERPPAPGQGCIVIQTRAEDVEAPWVKAMNHAPTRLRIAAERGALMALEGSCRTAMGAYTYTDGDLLRLVVEALAPDGSARWREEGAVAASAGEDAAHALGLKLGQAVRAAGGDKLEL